MSPLNTEDLHRTFKKLDQNGDGVVSLDELKCLLKRIEVQTSPEELVVIGGENEPQRPWLCVLL